MDANSDASDEDGSGDSGSDSGSEDSDEDDSDKKRSRDDGELSDEDYKMLQENLGEDAEALDTRKLKKKSKRFKKAIDSSDEEDEEEVAKPAKKEGQTLSDQLFGDSDDEEDAAPAAAGGAASGAGSGGAERFKGLSDDEDSEDPDNMDDFIEEEEVEGVDRAAKKKKRKKASEMTNEQKEAVELFGNDYLRFQEVIARADQEDYDEQFEDYYAEESKPKKQTKGIKEAYAPDELETQFLTDADDVIRKVDIPERIQLQFKDLSKRVVCNDEERAQEAVWIFKNAFSKTRLSETTDPILLKLVRPEQNSAEVIPFIDQAVKLMQWEEVQSEKIESSGPREVPYIAQYCKEAVGFPETLNMHDLWAIKHWDGEWHTLTQRRSRLLKSMEATRDYQERVVSNIEKKVSDVLAEEPGMADAVEGLENVISKEVPGAKAFFKINPLVFKALVAQEPDATSEMRQISDDDFDNVRKAETDQEITDFEAYARFHFGDYVELAKEADERLLAWCRTKVEGAQGLPLLTNFTSSFKNGYAFVCLMRAALEERGDLGYEGVFDRCGPGEIVENVRVSQDQGERLGNHVGTPFDLGFSNPVDFVRCDNPYLRLRPDKAIVETMADDGETTVKYYTSPLHEPEAAMVIGTLRRFQEFFRSIDPASAVREAAVAAESTGQQKKASGRRDIYGVCRKAGILPLTSRFGLSATQIGENLRNRYQEHVPVQQDIEPKDLADKFKTATGMFSKDADKVLDAAIQCLAMEIAADPNVRDFVREEYMRRATLTIRPTEKGKRVDAWEPVARYRYITHKQLKRLQDDDFIWIMQGEKDGLLKVTIAALHEEIDVAKYHHLESASSFYDDFFASCEVDEVDMLATQWNGVRIKAMKIVLTKHLLPMLQKEVRKKLTDEAVAFVTEQCANNIRAVVNRRPYENTLVARDEDDVSGGLRVLSIVVGDTRSEVPSYAAVLDGKGEVVDHAKLNFLLLSPNSRRIGDKKRRDSDWNQLRQLIVNREPEVVVIGASNLDCERFQQHVIEFIDTVSQEEEDMQPIDVHFGEVGMPRVYATSKAAERQFPDYEPRLREAIMLARRMQSPELAIASLFTTDDDVLNLKMHPLQAHIPQHELLSALSQELVTVINRTGVDINAAISSPFAAAGLPFIAGLGDRKASALVDAIKDRLDNGQANSREQLVEMEGGSIGPVVGCVCQGFLRVAPKDHEGENSAYNPLDKTRIHPRDYKLAKKIAKDAMDIVPNKEGDDPMGGAEDDEAEGAAAVQDVLAAPSNLGSLDLDNFGVQLSKMGMEKQKTVLDIRAEFQDPFKDERIEFQPLNKAQLFQCYSGESLFYYRDQTGNADDRDDGLVAGDPPHSSDFPRPELIAHGREESFFHDPVEMAPSLVLGQLVECQVSRVRYKGDDDVMEKRDSAEYGPAPTRRCCGMTFSGYDSCPNHSCETPQATHNASYIVNFQLNGKEIAAFPTQVSPYNLHDMKKKVMRGSKHPDGAQVLLQQTGHQVVATSLAMTSEELRGLAGQVIPERSMIVESFVDDWICGICFTQYDTHAEARACAAGDPRKGIAPECPGTPSGVVCKLENGLAGSIWLRDISDTRLRSPLERVQIGQTILARVKAVKLGMKMLELSSKSSQLRAERADFVAESGCQKQSNGSKCTECGDNRCGGNQYSAKAWGWDRDYDVAADDADQAAEKKKVEAKEKKKKYARRAIDHPTFKNLTYAQCEKHMRKSAFGETVIRPSSKGVRNLTISWKIADNITVHIDVTEDGKEDRAETAIGNKLIIGTDEFESIDEILALHINPAIDFARMLLQQTYCQGDEAKEEICNLLKADKTEQPERIPYYLTHMKGYPGRFIFSYMPTLRPKHEVVSIKPTGYKFRDQIFTSPNDMLRWFKQHYRDPIPRRGGSSKPEALPAGATPRYGRVHELSGGGAAAYGGGGGGSRGGGGGGGGYGGPYGGGTYGGGAPPGNAGWSGR